ncbi:MAG: sugar ABC transporter permease [Treponema sp.]|jgi:multiple sugar transport system permease protein/cellobiose transport system permease protein|nr:sugar ABC transporter permease [Treponema sp.]
MTRKVTQHSYLLKQKIAPYLFAAPYFIIFLTFAVFPIIFSAFISLNDWHGFDTPAFIGISNYIEVFHDRLFYKSLTNTFLLMAMVIPIQIILGFLISNFLNSRQMIWKKGFRLLNFLPYLTTPIALGIIFALLFDPALGIINTLLGKIGIPPVLWTREPWPARILVALVTIWRWTGYTAILFLAGLTNINRDYYEASEIDGANAFQRMRAITVPLLKPVIIFVVITTMIGCFQIFEEPFMIFTITGKQIGGPDYSVLTGIWLFYETAFNGKFRNGYGAAIAVCLFVIIAIISFMVNRLMAGKKED